MGDTKKGYEGRQKVEARLRHLEGGSGALDSSSAKKNGKLTSKKTGTYKPEATKAASKTTSYNDASDIVMDTSEREDDKIKKKEKKEKKEKKKKKKKKQALSMKEEHSTTEEKYNKKPQTAQPRGWEYDVAANSANNSKGESCERGEES